MRPRRNSWKGSPSPPTARPSPPATRAAQSGSGRCLRLDLCASWGRDRRASPPSPSPRTVVLSPWPRTTSSRSTTSLPPAAPPRPGADPCSRGGGLLASAVRQRANDPWRHEAILGHEPAGGGAGVREQLPGTLQIASAGGAPQQRRARAAARGVGEEAVPLDPPRPLLRQPPELLCCDGVITRVEGFERGTLTRGVRRRRGLRPRAGPGTR